MKTGNDLLPPGGPGFAQAVRQLRWSLSQSLEQQQPVYPQLRRTCELLSHLVRLARSQPEIGDSLRPCLKMLKTVVAISDYNKYGHQLATAMHLVCKFERLVNVSLEISQQEVYTKISQYEESAYRKDLQLLPISTGELAFRLTPDINAFFLSLGRQELAIPDSQCICCSQVLTADVPVINCNPLFRTMSELNVKKISEMVTLKRQVGGVCNAGGGLLLLGVERKQGLLYPTGLKFKSEQQILQTQNEIISAITSLRPECQYRVDRVLIKPTYMTGIDAQLTKVRLCFRVVVAPFWTNRISYIQFAVKGYQKAFEVFHMDSCGNVEEIGLGARLYQSMHAQYRAEHEVGNSHQHIGCPEPLPYYFKFNDQQSQKTENNHQNSYGNYKSDGSESQNSSYQQQKQDNPKFAYTNTTLLSVNSPKHNRYIKSFAIFLKNHNEKVQLSQPFYNSFKNCSRCIWMISYQMSQDSLKQYLETQSGNKQICPEFITVIPVHKNFQVERQKFSDYNEQIFNKKFKLKFNESYRTEDGIRIEKNQKQKSVVYFCFNDLSQAIYSYLAFQELSIRPFFIKYTPLMKSEFKTKSGPKS